MDMKIFHTDKQKDNLAKVFWDMGKIVFGVGSFVAGLIVGGCSWVLAYLLDGKELQQ